MAGDLAVFNERNAVVEEVQGVKNSGGQVFTLDNLSFLSYVFLPWFAHYGSNTTERCTMSLLGEMRQGDF